MITDNPDYEIDFFNIFFCLLICMLFVCVRACAHECVCMYVKLITAKCLDLCVCSCGWVGVTEGKISLGVVVSFNKREFWLSCSEGLGRA